MNRPRHFLQLFLAHERDLRAETIAERLGATPAAVYQRLSRLRSVLGDCIRQRLAEKSDPTSNVPQPHDFPRR